MSSGQKRCPKAPLTETAMKKIEATIPPFKLGDVKEELGKIDIQDFTVTEMKEFTSHAGHYALHRGAEAFVNFRVTIKVEAVCTTAQAPAVKDAVIRAAYSGRTSASVLSVSDIEQAISL
ncbi:P-II family nitrogen regulator [Pseudomonas sp. R2.Fl]|nr:P-II family nitrogen regulator [Pseudomonas sp. R2.Fl]